MLYNSKALDWLPICSGEKNVDRRLTANFADDSTRGYSNRPFGSSPVDFPHESTLTPIYMPFHKLK